MSQQIVGRAVFWEGITEQISIFLNIGPRLIL